MGEEVLGFYIEWDIEADGKEDERVEFLQEVNEKSMEN